LSPKNIIDQRVFKTSCTKNTLSALVLASFFSDSQIIDTDIPIIIKRIVHTGAKTQLGGFNGDLFMVVYQPLTAGAVKTEPMIPAI